MLSYLLEFSSCHFGTDQDPIYSHSRNRVGLQTRWLFSSVVSSQTQMELRLYSWGWQPWNGESGVMVYYWELLLQEHYVYVYWPSAHLRVARNGVNLHDKTLKFGRLVHTYSQIPKAERQQAIPHSDSTTLEFPSPESGSAYELLSSPLGSLTGYRFKRLLDFLSCTSVVVTLSHQS